MEVWYGNGRFSESHKSPYIEQETPIPIVFDAHIRSRNYKSSSSGGMSHRAETRKPVQNTVAYVPYMVPTIYRDGRRVPIVYGSSQARLSSYISIGRE